MCRLYRQRPLRKFEILDQNTGTRSARRQRIYHQTDAEMLKEVALCLTTASGFLFRVFLHMAAGVSPRLLGSCLGSQALLQLLMRRFDVVVTRQVAS